MQVNAGPVVALCGDTAELQGPDVAGERQRSTGEIGGGCIGVPGTPSRNTW